MYYIYIHMLYIYIHIIYIYKFMYIYILDIYIYIQIYVYFIHYIYIYIDRQIDRQIDTDICRYIHIYIKLRTFAHFLNFPYYWLNCGFPIWCTSIRGTPNQLVSVVVTVRSQTRGPQFKCYGYPISDYRFMKFVFRISRGIKI